MADIAEKMDLEFDDDLTCIFNDDNAKTIIPFIRIMNEEGLKGESQEQNYEYDVFLKKIESNMLTKLALKGFQILIKFLPSLEKSTSLMRMMDLIL